MITSNADLTPEDLLSAYSQGIFPMADSAFDDDFFWVLPKYRGIIPLNQFYLSRRLKRTIRSNRYEIRVDHDFSSVVNACAEEITNRETTWINAPIRRAYENLFASGHAHCIAAYDNDQLVGGLYGVRLGGAFFGESMFHRARDASKVVLAHLVGRLIAGGFTLLDSQFFTEHLGQFGAIEVPQNQYQELLNTALPIEANWDALPLDIPLSGVEITTIVEEFLTSTMPHKKSDEPDTFI